MKRPLFYNIVHSRTFDHQLLTVAAKDWPLVYAKVDHLRYAPEPDGKNKKILEGYKQSLFRIRAGDYRIIYDFNTNEGWVRLIGVDGRPDVYRRGILVADDREITLDSLGADDHLLEPESPPPDHRGSAPSDIPPEADTPIEPEPDSAEAVAVPPPVVLKPVPTELPKRFDRALLEQMRIASKYHVVLNSCRTLDDLIAAAVPEVVRERAWIAMVAPNYDDVLDEPVLTAESAEDFRRFLDGSLLQFLLKLDPDQQRFVDWAMKGSGPALIKGGPGTGKTLVALYRVRSLIAALRGQGIARPRILFTSYTNTLIEASRQILGELLAVDLALVTICTADKQVWDLMEGAGQIPKTRLDSNQARARIVNARKRMETGSAEDQQAAAAIEPLNLDFLLNEVDEIIVARELPDLDAYLAGDRSGRGRRLTVSQRRAIWRLHEIREENSAKTDELTWSQYRRRAVNVVREMRNPPRYDAVLIDEAQDLEPTMLRLLTMLCKTPDRLFLTADPNQSIYGGGFRWADVHQDLRFQGRTGILRRNYRSTRQISRAAESYLAGAELDLSDAPTACVRNGPVPLIRAASTKAGELDLIVGFIQESTRTLRVGLGGCAILVQSEQLGMDLEKAIKARGFPAKFMKGKGVDLQSTAVKVIPMKTAKGLEFPIVAVAGLSPGYPGGIPPNALEDQVEELQQIGRRALYVAMTRATEALLVVVPAGRPTLTMDAFDPECWNLETETASPDMAADLEPLS